MHAISIRIANHGIIYLPRPKRVSGQCSIRLKAVVSALSGNLRNMLNTNAIRLACDADPFVLSEASDGPAVMHQHVKMPLLCFLI